MIDHLLFTISNRIFAIPTVRISEVERYKDLRIDPVPSVPHHILGIINLRGEVIPIMCGRRRLGMSVAQNERSMRLLILMTLGYRYGFLVDSIIGTYHLDDRYMSVIQDEMVRSMLPFNMTYQCEEVLEGGMVHIIDVDRLALPFDGGDVR